MDIERTKEFRRELEMQLTKSDNQIDLTTQEIRRTEGLLQNLGNNPLCHQTPTRAARRPTRSSGRTDGSRRAVIIVHYSISCNSLPE